MASYIDIEDEIAEKMNWRGSSFKELDAMYKTMSPEQISALKSGDNKRVLKAFGQPEDWDWGANELLTPWEYYTAVKSAKKKAAMADMDRKRQKEALKELHNLADSVTEEEVAPQMLRQPINQDRWNEIRSMYGTSE